MKKTAVILLGLGLLLTACQQKEVQPTTVGEVETVNVTLYASDAISVRSSSSSGGLTNVSGYYQRYMLAVYDESGENVVEEAQTKVADENGGAVTFSLSLSTKQTYKFVAWADLVTDNTDATDLHYDTSNFPSVSYNDDYTINDESFDAYYASEAKTVTGSDLTLTLKRPFAKLRLVTTDWEEDIADQISITYDSGRYTTFNALDGSLSNAEEVKEFSAGLADLSYTDETEPSHTLVVDYLFATDEESTVHISYTASKDGDELNSLVIGKDIPLQRNYLTTVTGNLLTSNDSFSFGISISDGFEGNKTTEQVGSLTLDSDKQITYNGEQYYYVAIGGTVTMATSFTDVAADSWTWTSSDPDVATVEKGTGDNEGKAVVTGVSTGLVTITATYEDTENNVNYSCSGYLYVPDLGGVYVSGNAVNVPIDASSFTDFWSAPQGSSQTLTWELADDSSESEVISITSAGVITAKGFGTATVKATSSVTDDEYIADGYSKELTVTVTVPHGYYDEAFSTTTTNWVLNTGQSSSWTWSQDTTTGEGYYTITTTAGRADIGHYTTSSSNSFGANGDYDVYLDPTAYPIICFRFDDLHDSNYTCNINIDVSGHLGDDGNNGDAYSGEIGTQVNNGWETKYTCSDGSAIIVNNLKTAKFTSSTSLDTGGILPSLAHFGTFQIKYADIKDSNNATPSSVSYRYFWFKTFASEAEMTSFLSEWSTETGITYEESEESSNN